MYTYVHTRSLAIRPLYYSVHTYIHAHLYISIYVHACTIPSRGNFTRTTCVARENVACGSVVLMCIVHMNHMNPTLITHMAHVATSHVARKHYT